MTRRGDWIQTFSGLAFWPLDPRPDEIVIEDIAHALAMQCRFTGHVGRFYSVAEHSVHVSRVCSPTDALWGLLHDASEAYLSDVARPVKRLHEFQVYKSVEAELQAAIAKRFGLDADEPESVQRADKVLLGIEARDLMAPLRPGWEKWLALIGDENLSLTRTWAPEEAEERFLSRFRELTMPRVVAERITVQEAASILGRHAAARRILRKKGKETGPALFAETA